MSNNLGKISVNTNQRKIQKAMVPLDQQIAYKAREISLNPKYNNLKFSNSVLCVTTDQTIRGFFFEQMLLQGEMLKMFQNYSQYKSLKSLIKKYKNFYNANDQKNMRDTGNNILMEIYGLPQDFQSKLFNIYLNVINLFAESNTNVDQWKQMLDSYNYNFLVYSLSPISQQLFSGIVPKNVRYTKKSICPVIMATVLEKMIEDLKTARVNVTLTNPMTTVNKSVNKKTNIVQSNVSITLGIPLQSRRKGVDNDTIEFMFGSESIWIPIETYKSMGGPFRIVGIKNKTMYGGRYNTEIVIMFKNMKFKFVLSTTAPAAINHGTKANRFRRDKPTGREIITVSIGQTKYIRSTSIYTARQDYGQRHVTSEFNFKIIRKDLLNNSDMCEGIALAILIAILICFF